MGADLEVDKLQRCVHAFVDATEKLLRVEEAIKSLVKERRVAQDEIEISKSVGVNMVAEPTFLALAGQLHGTGRIPKDPSKTTPVSPTPPSDDDIVVLSDRTSETKQDYCPYCQASVDKDSQKCPTCGEPFFRCQYYHKPVSASCSTCENVRKEEIPE